MIMPTVGWSERGIIMEHVLHALIGDLSAPAVSAVKAATLFITATVLFRLTGRRHLADFAPFDWLVTAAAGAIVGRAATAPDTSWLSATAALVSLLATHALLTRLRLIPRLRCVIDPPQQILVRDGVIVEDNVRRCGLTAADLHAILRQHGHCNTDRIHLAIFEAQGVVSIFVRDESFGERCGTSS